MTAVVERARAEDICELISYNLASNLDTLGLDAMYRAAQNSDCLWIGKDDEKILGFWGLIAPTLLSTQAYLWLYTLPGLTEHTFIFIRHSQRVVRDMLKIYPTIVGHGIVGNEQSLRWLEWLGAKFSEPTGSIIPFEIKAKQ